MKSKIVVPSLLVAALATGACGTEQTGEAAVPGIVPRQTASPVPLDTPSTASSASTPDPAGQATGPVSGLPPNELGEILVLEYHRLGEDESEYTRSAASFRADLQKLYERGYRPISLRALARGEIDLPAGTTPVVFTIDDASLGQFYYRDDGSIDPNTMMGIWSAFREENPAWSGGAVWCILPGAEYPSNFFGERSSRDVPREQREETIRRKMEYLLENGHEICNHTMWHARLDRYDDAFVQNQIGSGEDSIAAYLPADYDIVTFALPLGMWPKNRSLAWKGTYRDGKSYEYGVVLEVAGGPNPSPFDTAFDPRSVDRFVMAPGALERQLDTYERHPGRRYVSDGAPDVVTVPQSLAGQLDRERLDGRNVELVEDVGAIAADDP